VFIAVFVTVPDSKTAKKISKALLLKRLCACVNIIKDIQSFFWWQDRIDEAKEHLLIIKTKKALFAELEKEVISLHPYAVPEIIALDLVNVSKKYAAWLKKETE